jgi:hypothetical protein
VALDRAKQEKYLEMIAGSLPTSAQQEVLSGAETKNYTLGGSAVVGEKSTPAERAAGSEMKGATPAVEKSTSAERDAADKTSLMLAGDTVAGVAMVSCGS